MPNSSDAGRPHRGDIGEILTDDHLCLRSVASVVAPTADVTHGEIVGRLREELGFGHPLAVV